MLGSSLHLAGLKDRESWPKLLSTPPTLVFYCYHNKLPQLGHLKLTQEHGFTLLQLEAQRPWVSKQKH